MGVRKERQMKQKKKYVELWHPLCFPLSRCHHVESKMSLSFKMITVKDKTD